MCAKDPEVAWESGHERSPERMSLLSQYTPIRQVRWELAIENSPGTQLISDPHVKPVSSLPHLSTPQ